MSENDKFDRGSNSGGSSEPDTSSSSDAGKDITIVAKPNAHDVEPPPEKVAGPGPPPDGGIKAWLQVVGGFLLVLNTW